MSGSDSAEERLARLEERMLSSIEDRKELWSRIDKLVDAQENMTAELHKIVLEMTNWKGKFGGIILVVGCVWAFLTVAWSSIIGYFKYVSSGG